MKKRLKWPGHLRYRTLIGITACFIGALSPLRIHAKEIENTMVSSNYQKAEDATAKPPEQAYTSFDYEIIGSDRDETRILKYTGTEKDVVIPAKIDGRIVTEIAEKAFYKSQIVEKVSFEGNQVDFIGENAFYGCSNLTTVNLSQTKVETIDSMAFANCKKLKFAFFPDTMKHLGENAFENCQELDTVWLGKSLEVIEQRAFANCTSLKSIFLPETLKQMWTFDASGIYGGVFYGCINLETVMINSKLSMIPDNTFYKCSSLTSFTMPDSVTWVGERAFSQCVNLSSIRFSNQLKYIGKGAFAYCRSLKSIALPDSLTVLESGTLAEDFAFGACTSLSSVSLGNNLSILQSNTFSGCTALLSISIPESVVSIGNGAFNRCTSLKSVYFQGKVPQFQEDAFMKGNDKLRFYYLEGYSKPVVGKYIFEIYEIDKTHYNVTFRLDGGKIGDVENTVNAYCLIGRSIAEPEQPVRKGYTFDGWATTGGSKWDFSKDTVNASITLTAQWKVNRYLITFNAMDGSSKEETRFVDYGKSVGILPVPQRMDYKFEGWFTEVNGLGKVYTTSTLMGAADIILYAKWSLSPKVPEAPVVTVSEYSPTKVKVMWKKLSGIAGYDVYRASSANGQYIKIGTAKPEAIGWLSTNLTKGKTYYYRVKAFRTMEGQKFYGEYSTKVRIKLISKPAQAQLIAKKKSRTTADLSWNVVDSADGYQVAFKSGSSGKYKIFATYTKNVTGCYHTKLAPDKTYYYKVRAYTVVNGAKVYGNYSTVHKVKL